MTDADLIRDAREHVKDEVFASMMAMPTRDLITRLAAALEERGKQSSDRFDRARQAEASARHWEERALAAEQSRDRLLADRKQLLQTILMQRRQLDEAYGHPDAALRAPDEGEVRYTTGHCENRRRPGGCQLHNLHCGYPDCDRRPTPPPAGSEK